MGATLLLVVGVSQRPTIVTVAVRHLAQMEEPSPGRRRSRPVASASAECSTTPFAAGSSSHGGCRWTTPIPAWFNANSRSGAALRAWREAAPAARPDAYRAYRAELELEETAAAELELHAMAPAA